jgi:CO/xanthine dehydrogenase Mo-binding subunit
VPRGVQLWTEFASDSPLEGDEARRAETRRRGRYRGIGIAASVELNTGAPRERAEMTIDPSGVVELVLATMSAGQGHETSFAQIVSEWLGVDANHVRLVTGDTDRAQAGGGSASARSIRLGWCAGFPGNIAPALAVACLPEEPLSNPSAIWS